MSGANEYGPSGSCQRRSCRPEFGGRSKDSGTMGHETIWSSPRSSSLTLIASISRLISIIYWSSETSAVGLFRLYPYSMLFLNHSGIPLHSFLIPHVLFGTKLYMYCAAVLEVESLVQIFTQELSHPRRQSRLPIVGDVTSKDNCE